jgi:hypothetical protein
MLQDGCLYSIERKTRNLNHTFETLGPNGCMPSANEVIGTLQRKVEAARGFFGRYDDDAGLTFTSQDANSIASWSYYRDAKCQLDISLARCHVRSRELHAATGLLDAALKGDMRHFRTFIVFYIYSNKKSEISSTLFDRLQKEQAEKGQLQACLRLSTWMKNEQAKDGRDKNRSFSILHKSILEKSLATALQRRIHSVLLTLVTLLIPSPNTTNALDIGNLRYCTFLAIACYAVSNRLKDRNLSDASLKLKEAIGIGKLTDGDSFDTGERCKACGSGITFSSESMLSSKCQKGHLWSECRAGGEPR